MPLPNGRNASAKPSRSKSTSAVGGKLPPVVSQESRQRAEAMKKAINRPKTAHRNSRPPTSTYTLPSFGNGRLPTASKNMKLAMNRSSSETRPLPKIEYGRSLSREKLTDLKDELFHAKKKVANYENDMKKLNTEMQRLRRDADKRETFLERIVTAQYHPTELNDTNLARTLTSIKRKEMAKENLIDIQYKELERLRSLLKESHISTEPSVSNKAKNQREEVMSSSEIDDDNDEEDESDYPEEPAQEELTNLTSKIESDEESDDVFERAPEKKIDKSRERERTATKERNELAKKYAEQNAKLKQRLKDVKQNYEKMVEKHKRKGEEYVKQSENSKAVVEKTVEISSALNVLQKEREELTALKVQNEEKINDLSHELIEAYGEIDALKMHNEKLQESLRDLEMRVENPTIEPDYETLQPINIPRLDMSDIDNADNCTLHETTERSDLTQVSEFNHEHLADALAEIAGAHCERLRIITQS